MLNEAVDSEALEQVVATDFRGQTQANKASALAGKALPGTAGQTRGHPLRAVYATPTGVVVGQMTVDQTVNESVAAPELLKTLPREGRVVTGDAMFAHQALSEQIVQAHGDYRWSIKDNQPLLRAAIERVFAPEVCGKAPSPLHTDFQVASRLNNGHGRLERRTLTRRSLLNSDVDWEGLGQVFKSERHVTPLTQGLVTDEVEYGIPRLKAHPASAQHVLHLVREQWPIENGVHDPRHVSFREEACPIRWPVAHRPIAILN